MVAAGGFALTGEFWQSASVAVAVAAVLVIGVRFGLWARVFRRRPACYTLPPEVHVERKSERASNAPTQTDVVRSWLTLF
jgi:uncharacterized membrane protein